MSKYGIWQINESGPVKLTESKIDLEKNLESWIEIDPSMLLPGGWDIVCRQMQLDGGRLDLLALDPQGRWVVIELKAGFLDHDVVTQGIYYAAQIDKMPFEQLESKVHWYLNQRGTTLNVLLDQRGITEDDQKKGREVQLVLVGTQRSSGIDTMLEFMTKKSIAPITIVTFEVYKLENGQRILVRELREENLATAEQPVRAKDSQAEMAKLQKTAEQIGIGQEFGFLAKAATDLGIYPRPFVRSVMFTAPKNKTITLFTVNSDRKPLRAWISPRAFPWFYPVTEEQSLNLLGPEGWRDFDLPAVQQFVAGLTNLLADKGIQP